MALYALVRVASGTLIRTRSYNRTDTIQWHETNLSNANSEDGNGDKKQHAYQYLNNK